MEGISKIVSGAGQALYGDQHATTTNQHEEPLSGQTGNTRVGEPYDAGNMGEEQNFSKQPTAGPGYTQKPDSAAFSTSHEIPRGETATNAAPAAGPGYTQKPDSEAFSASRQIPRDDTGTATAHAAAATGALESANDGPRDTTPYRDTSSDLSPRSSGVPAGTIPIPAHSTGKRESKAENIRSENTRSEDTTTSGRAASNTDAFPVSTGTGIAGGVGGHTTASAARYDPNDPSNTGAGASSSTSRGEPKGAPAKHQGANAPQAGPTGGEEEAVRESKKDAESAAREPESSESHKKDFGADAGAYDGGGSSAPGGGGSSAGAGAGAPGGGELGGQQGGRKQSMTGHLPGAPGGEGLQKTSQGEGTGEKWVKSSGMKAEGGDFDASAPGAGREADRLLQESGVQRTGADPKKTTGETDTNPPPHHGEEGGKMGMKDKIKAKLHKS